MANLGGDVCDCNEGCEGCEDEDVAVADGSERDGSEVGCGLTAVAETGEARRLSEMARGGKSKTRKPAVRGGG